MKCQDLFSLKNKNKKKNKKLLSAAVVIGALRVNPFSPEFLKWTFLSLNLDTSVVANRDASQKLKTEWRTV